VLRRAAPATALAAVAVIGIARESNAGLFAMTAAWWLVAVLTGMALGRRAETSAPIARVLAGARSQTTLPELQPARTLLNRLWPLLLSTIGAGGLAVFLPQVASIAAGFAIIWALAWRRQEAAVAAIEERDGVRFYIDRTSPLQPIRLVRTPGFGGVFLPRV
jgi:small-conductance mechanosensitive channel